MTKRPWIMSTKLTKEKQKTAKKVIRYYHQHFEQKSPSEIYDNIHNLGWCSKSTARNIMLKYWSENEKETVIV
jgi:hypothetical protein